MPQDSARLRIQIERSLFLNAAMKPPPDSTAIPLTIQIVDRPETKVVLKLYVKH